MTRAKSFVNLDHVELPAEMLEQLEALPIRKGGNPGVRWTPEKDAALLRYWNSGRRKKDVAKVIGHSQGACLKRYRELTE